MSRVITERVEITDKMLKSSKRLIDADALMRDVEHYHLSDGKFQHWIEIQPTIEERKKGRWNRRKGMYEVGFKCSECNSFSIAETPYCSFCGARMEGNT